ncbi:TonB-dependent receptor [Bacteroides sp. 224]|uniref:SusC/RagA family TonB-linked outer membrane protein n=1 Tax=Bacteroides sp. 224 TaxID=2302936 RepID=UPI0013D10DF7|nr:TonB-dependent receptor [Bacteroides sp. 224]NDV64064.1 TonB-dependent receptor [Bacteroides sp. 224]
MKHKNIFKLYVCMILVVLIALPATAQNIQTISGTVVDESGEAIIGASVMVEGTSTGTITDFDGKYSLKVPEKGKLKVSFIGYITQIVSDMGKASRIILMEDNLKLDEVVVVGYGSQKGKNVTGSIEVLDMKDIQDLAVTNLGDALAGMISGLHVSSSGNKPGSAAHLTIRQSSELAKNNGAVNAKFSTQDDTPLYIIDDFFSTEEAFNALDPSEVESISVLKDASAAIYGAQGAYGVILVKTKRGKVSVPQISYSGQFGFTDALFKPKMMSAYDYGRTWNGYKGTPNGDNEEILAKSIFQADELETMKSLNYDLLDNEWSSALTQRHSININGGTEKATYFAGVSYNTQDGNLGKLDYERWNYRAGVNVNLNKWIKTSLQVSGHYGETKKPKNKYGNSDSGDYNLLLQHLRFVPETIDGFPIIHQGMDQDNKDIAKDYSFNFHAIQNSPDYAKNDNNGFSLNGSVEVDMGWIKPLKGLKLKAAYSKNVDNTKYNEVATSIPVYRMMQRGGSGGHLYSGLTASGEELDYSITNFAEYVLDNGNNLTRKMTRGDNYQLNFIATYARQFGLHDVSGLFSIERGESESEYLDGLVLSPLSYTDGQSNSGTGKQEVAWGRSESGRLSYIGRLNYSYADKYLLEFLIRSDASTKFAPKNYWGVFPSVSAGWIISEESWFNKEKLGIDFLKIRGSFGMLGRDNINPFVWLTRYNRSVNENGAVFGVNSMGNNLSSGITIEQGGANPDAHWDKTYKTNFGLDMRFLNSRLSVNVDGYYDMGREIFGSHQGTKYFPMTVGLQPTPENFVEKDVYGVELSIGWKDKIGKDFTYWVKLNTGYSDDKVKLMAVKEVIGVNDPIPNKRQDRGLWGYECIGMFRDYQQIEEYFAKYNITSYMGMGKEAVRPGMLIYKDNGGKWDPVKKQYDSTPDGIVSLKDDEDKIKISHRSDNPYGMTFNFGGSFKSFSIQAQLGASWGGKVMAGTGIRKSATKLEYTNIPDFWKDMYVYEDVIDSKGNVVAAQNRNAKYPNLQYDGINNHASTFWVVDGTTISIRNLSLAYTVPKKWLRVAGVESCRLNLTCQNVVNFVSPHFEDAWSSWGGTYGNYPNLRKITLGVNLSF